MKNYDEVSEEYLNLNQIFYHLEDICSKEFDDSFVKLNCRYPHLFLQVYQIENRI